MSETCAVIYTVALTSGRLWSPYGVVRGTFAGGRPDIGPKTETYRNGSLTVNTWDEKRKYIYAFVHADGTPMCVIRVLKYDGCTVIRRKNSLRVFFSVHAANEMAVAYG